MLERIENGNLKSEGSNSLSSDVASVKIGGDDNQAYAGVPQSDDPKTLERDGEQEVDKQNVSMLAAHCIGAFDRARDDRQTNLIDDDLLKCLRQFKGQYEPDEESRFSERGLPLVYFPLSEHKVHTGIAWIDEFFTNGETLINIRPTPLPEMENDVVATTYINAMKDVAEVVQQTGQIPSPEMLEKYASLMRQIIEQHVDDVSKERALKMERIIRDDLVEGRWSEKIHELVGMTCVYGTAALRCPVIKIKNKLSWKNGEPVREERIVRTFEAISPFDIFPAPGATDTQHGNLCVRVRYGAIDLQKFKGVPSWIDSGIDEVLMRYGLSGVKLEISSDSQRRELDSHRSSVYDNGVIEGFEYWGDASGQMLAELGITTDAHGKEIKATGCDWYSVNAIVIGDTAVYCRVMDDGEERPIDAVKFYDTPGDFWGRGMLQIIRPLQKICNAAGRSLVTNMAFASGPQSIVDAGMLDPRDDMKLRAFKTWVVRRNAMTQNNGKPVEFFNVDSHAKELMSIFDYFQRVADELTGIPAYANGTDAATGAARTASGLNMLMGQANRGIKKVIGNFDELVRHCVNRLVEWHMLHNDDKSIRGDISVEVTGLRYFVTKTSRANDILNMVDRITQNPALQGLPGVKRLCNLLHEVGIAMDLGAYALAPSEDELKREMELQKQQMAAQQQQAEAQAAEQAMAQTQQQIAIEQAKAAGRGAGEVPSMPMPSGNANGEGGEGVIA